MACILIAACLGALGPGLLSKKQNSSANGQYSVGYDGVLHLNAPSQIEIRTATIDEGNVRVRISEPFFRAAVIDDAATLVLLQDGQTSSPKSFTEQSAHRNSGILRYRPQKIGRLEFDLSFADATELHVSQLVLP